MGPVEQQIADIVTAALAPTHLQLSNESHMHSVPPGSESHFKLLVVSTAFEGQRKVARHQRLYALLAEQLAGPVHALALHTHTPTEWQAVASVPDSPNCLGGSKAD
ncbi:BolA/IbaG family iron-sulfur metabolism protein [Gammaproteobacteria bacterium LSUCC0057]|mgnify:FL=1|uniref:BolA/IbaG family iron-sulfur metabolism protein n=1 Tax=Gammaproteobacteria bacterium LSUCC0057 TaxID=2559237 RepID=A0A4Y8UK64_9GAMM|nr:BolA/IbaG family iron-sulfur metabolism protein [Gammaproteobacteria bacterium LSUCC0057]